jgi:N4-(beta-N-acetylglucosaminyl)-L-asparaginase
MPRRLSRREFVKTGAAAGAALAVPAARAQTAASPTMLTRKTTAPVVVSSFNGHTFKNGGTRTAVEEAFVRLTRDEDVLDALIAGVNIVELDPLDDSVGYGGIPNAEGVVQLDSACMHGPTGRAGGVAALEGVRTPSLVARAVMNETDHHLLVGAGAQAFARQLGFTIESDLNTESSRHKWLEWKRRLDPEHYLSPEQRNQAANRARAEMLACGQLDPEHVYGTIHCSGRSTKGELASVTTTSGLSFKIPGRVGDSPILGAGLYTDGHVGSAGSTGRGEANLLGLSSFLIVEELRRGRTAKDAGMEALKRIASRTVEKRLLDDQGHPKFQVKFYVLDHLGNFAGVALIRAANADFAVCTENGPELRPCEILFG